MPEPPPDSPRPDASPAAVPQPPLTFRPRHIRAVLLLSGVALLAAFSAIGLLPRGLGPGDRLSFVLTGALLLAALALLARPRIEATEEGLHVVNIVTSRRLDWAELVQVNLRPGDPWAYLDLSDGTSLPALGIQPGMARQQAVDDARTLRTLVAARSGRTPGGPAD
ncbi:PH domain-containing protein [Streptomyces sp. NPDC058045]|uniref:PH domain-containing protein n=1 Tax=Streptomyces sp. NPDC058045 TaxID=3346311 RepID=UPI0036F10E05